MKFTMISEFLSKRFGQMFTSGRVIALAVLVAFTAVTIQPAHAQSSDTWKSVAIIGGSTAAGAIVGHMVAGRTGMIVGAGAGAAAGYAIDRKRRQDEYNQYGYYPNNGGYYPANGGYYPGQGGYYPGPYGGNGYTAGSYQTQGNGYASNRYQAHYSRRHR